MGFIRAPWLLALALCATPCVIALPVNMLNPTRPGPGSRVAAAALQREASMLANQGLRGGAAAVKVARPALREQKSIRMPVISCFFYFLSIALTAPAMPSMANKMINKDGSTRVSPEGVSLYGTMASVDQIFTVMFTKLWGSLSDVHGRKPFMMFSGVGAAIGWWTVVQAAKTSNMPLLFAGRALDGVTSCMQPICQSAIRDMSPQDKLKENFGYLLGISVGGAFIVGAIIGGILTSRRGPEVAMMAASGAAVTGIIVTYLFGQETLPIEHRAEKMDWLEANPFGALHVLTRDRVTAGAAMSYLLVWTALNGLQTNLFSYLEHRYGWGRTHAAMLQAQVGIMLAFTQALGPKLLIPIIGAVGAVKLGLGIWAVAALIMASAPTGGIFSIGCVASSGGCLCLPILMGIVSDGAGANESGAVLSALECALTMNRIFAFKGMAMLFAYGMRRGFPGGFFVLCSMSCVVAIGIMTAIQKDIATERVKPLSAAAAEAKS
mmetsp:Transcript_62887/g.144133  ORF Transcript_62887/g.144133 Transcript_62887/m.144133 type:complete len:494 (+) Transcript_62887:46-1527(+)